MTNSPLFYIFFALLPMLIKQIISFFSTLNFHSTTKEELHEIRNYQSGDDVRFVNWKKTATFNKLMTNTFEEEKKIAWYMVFVANQNSKKWLYESTKKRYEELIEQITLSAEIGKLDPIKTKIVKLPPKASDYQHEKQIIISDFFWDKESLHDFFQACQRWVARGIIPQLYTETGEFLHPLTVKYPQYFFSQDLT